MMISIKNIGINVTINNNNNSKMTIIIKCNINDIENDSNLRASKNNALLSCTLDIVKEIDE